MTKSAPPPAIAAATRESVALARRFEAIIVDWDGTAVPDRGADATRVRKLVEEAPGHGLELAVASGTDLGDVDGQLAARPRGPGGLVLALNRGSEVFTVDREGPQLAFRRIATADEEAALSHAARLTVERLATRGLSAGIVSERPGGRKIDLVPEPEWENPPKARIRELLAAVGNRLTAAGIAGLPEVVTIARGRENARPARGLRSATLQGTRSWRWRRVLDNALLDR